MPRVQIDVAQRDLFGGMVSNYWQITCISFIFIQLPRKFYINILQGLSFINFINSIILR